MKFFVQFAILLSLISCSSTQERQLASGESIPAASSDDSHPAAYGMQSFWLEKPRPQRNKADDVEFFFKHCTGSMDRSYFSKTSYTCERP